MIRSPDVCNTLYLLVSSLEVFSTTPFLVHTTLGGGLADGGLQGNKINEPSVTSTILRARVAVVHSSPNATEMLT